MKIIITGAKGQLGSQITSVLERNESEIGKISKLYKTACIKGTGKDDLDITKLNDVENFILEYKPDIVINSAAYTDVDGCEVNSELAYRVNSLGPRNIAIACEKVKAKLVQLSTDYVFKGHKNIPYREYDIADPINIYGKTKQLGENYVQQFCSKYFIVRTAWLYGINGKSFVKTIIRTAKEKGYLDVVNDQIGNPTNAEDLAHHILKLALTEEYGIYHCSGHGECSWFDFANEIVKYAQISCTINSITSDKLNRKAKRPSYSVLDNMMLMCTVGDEMRHWKEALKTFIEKERL